jgi:hypothetical protein
MLVSQFFCRPLRTTRCAEIRDFSEAEVLFEVVGSDLVSQSTVLASTEEAGIVIAMLYLALDAWHAVTD